MDITDDALITFAVREPLVDIRVGDCLERLRQIPDESIDCCVTSPPFFGLRDYGTAQWEGGDPACDHRQQNRHQVQGASSARAGRSNVEAQRNDNFRHVCGRCGAQRVDRQIGMEASPDAYVATLVEVFREVRRTLKRSGTLWLNLGDSYANDSKWGGSTGGKHAASLHGDTKIGRARRYTGAKPKDLLMIPARVALALQGDGWWIRSDVIWHKPSALPESVRDRPTAAHEHVFLLTKSPSYFYDSVAVKEPSVMRPQNRFTTRAEHPKGDAGRQAHTQPQGGTRYESRNRRNVWTIATKPFNGAHFAVMPPALAEVCILAGTSAKGHCPHCGARWLRGDDWRPGCDCPDNVPVPDVVLDPFGGAGTTGLVAQQFGRAAILIELSPIYAELASKRIG